MSPKVSLNQVFTIKEEQLVYTRTQEGNIMIYLAKDDGALPETFVIDGLALTIFELLDGKRSLSRILEMILKELNIEETAIPELQSLACHFINDLVINDIIEPIQNKT